MTEFTIVLPTTGDRHLTLTHVLPFVQRQSLQDWELIVIGDGVSDATRDALRDWSAREPRLRFVDQPKDVRRGELYRHAVLAHARSRFIAYLCDRDLWLHDHLQRLRARLQTVDFAHTTSIEMLVDGSSRLSLHCRIERRSHRREAQRRGNLPIGMSTVAHTLEAYRRLPFGWRTTPMDRKTDHYMWHQFLSSSVSAASEPWPTVLYFNRGDHPGWPSAQRGAELALWAARLDTPVAQDQFRDAAIREQCRLRQRLRRGIRSLWYWYPRWRPLLDRLRPP